MTTDPLEFLGTCVHVHAVLSCCETLFKEGGGGELIKMTGVKPHTLLHFLVAVFGLRHGRGQSSM